MDVMLEGREGLSRGPKALRMRCAVPFCAHTRGRRKGEQPIKPGEEWVCGEHWRLTSRDWRRRMGLFRRRQRWDLVHQMWQRLKEQAIERACGL